jgi:hypothetical protein
MRKILISNNVPFHYEIVESAITQYDYLLKIDKLKTDKVYVYVVPDHYQNPPGMNYYKFVEYLSNKYKNIVFLKTEPTSEYDYEIHCTATSFSAKETDGGVRPIDIIQDSSHAYIAHDLDKELFLIKNVFFLSNFSKTIPDDRVFNVTKLPIYSVEKPNVPIFCIQGSFTRARFDRTRNYQILEQILSYEYDKDFKILVLGGWHHEEPFDIGYFFDLSKIHNSNIDKMNVKINLDWEEYHRIFNSAYGIIPSIDKDSQPWYFKNKITSSYIYSKAYNLKVFADKDFFTVYNIKEDNVVEYSKETFSKSFNSMVNSFYM